jgi:hypothetical protein
MNVVCENFKNLEGAGFSDYSFFYGLSAQCYNPIEQRNPFQWLVEMTLIYQKPLMQYARKLYGHWIFLLLPFFRIHAYDENRESSTEGRCLIYKSLQLEIFCQTFILLELQHVSMSRPDRLKRQPTANTTPQSTPSFDPIDPDKEAASQRSDVEEVTGAMEEKRGGRQKSSGGRNPSASQK